MVTCNIIACSEVTLDPNMVYDRALWRTLIHVADPTWWDKAWWLLLLFGSNLKIYNGELNFKWMN
jgi:hypothetical protein